MSFTIDVWCNSDMHDPANIKSYLAAVGEDQDPCIVYVSLEHAAGCPVLDFNPILTILGVCMLFFGTTLCYFGRKV